MTRSAWQHIAAFIIVVLLGAGVWYRRAQLHEAPFPADGPVQLVSQTVHGAMGTQVDISVGARDQVAARRDIQLAFDEMARLEGMMSHRIDSSAVARFNRTEANVPVKLPDELAEVVEQSLAVSTLSDGAFDITVKPLIDLYKTTRGRPTAEQLAEARGKVGYRRLIFDPETKTLAKTVAGMQIDLGGIAKGAIVDRVVDLLHNKGYRHVMVNAGGDIRCIGGHPEGRPWAVGIKHPSGDSDTSLIGVVRLTDGAVVTSGNYERFTPVDGKRLSHILDPRTGRPADALPSVTVRAKTAGQADALATAVSVLGLDSGMKLVESLPEAEGLLVDYDGQTLTPHASSGFGYEMTKPSEIHP